MAVCQNCNANLSDESVFCSNCGAKLVPVNAATAQPVQAEPVKGSVQHNGKATVSLILGIIGLFVWIIPFLGFPVSVVGIVMGAMGMKSQKSGMAIAGMVLSIIALIATIVSAVIGTIYSVQIMQDFMQGQGYNFY